MIRFASTLLCASLGLGLLVGCDDTPDSALAQVRPDEGAAAQPATAPTISTSAPAQPPSAQAASEDRAPDESAANATPIDPPPDDGLVFVSNDGSYRIVCQVLADPIPVNEPFDMNVWVLDRNDEVAAEYDAVSIDAAMPHHRHGMNQYPAVTKIEAGRYHVDGMLFHMPGYWEIYVDVANGPAVERGQVSVDVE